MKHYTSIEQTAKLVDMGFEKPKSITSISWEEFKEYGVMINVNSIKFDYHYSIGELIEMLPPKITLEDCIYSRVISENEVFYYSWELETYFCICDNNSQLVDNLFDAIVKLKEEGVI